MDAEYLVTGGGGFIGSNLVHALAGRGRTVRVLDNFATGRRANLDGCPAGVELVEGDVRDPAAVARAARGCRFVLHQAALPSVVRSVEDPLLAHDVNVNGTLNVLLQARDAGVERVVFASSSSVYGDTPELPKREDMRPEPLSPYAVAKLTGEHYGRVFHRLYGLRTFALRYFNVFGPRQDPASQYAAVIPLFIRALRGGGAPTIHGDGGQTRDFTFVADVVEANLCCCSAPEEAAGGVYNVAWGRRISVLDLLRRLAAILGVEARPVFTPARAGDVRDSHADATLAQTLLGWRPRVEIEKGLRETVAWFLKAEGGG